MKKAILHKLMDLLEDVKKIDALILLYQRLDASSIMLGQYEAKKTKLVGEVIDQLVSLPIQSEQSFSLIQLIIRKYYPSLNEQITYDKEISQLVAAI